jgi:hypothetical protein
LEGLRGQDKFFLPPEVEEALLRFLHHIVRVSGPFQIVSDVYAEELEAFHLLHCGPSMWMVGDGLRLLSPEVHDQLLRFVDIEGEVIFLAQLSQGPHLLVGCLVIVGNQSYYCCVVCKLDFRFIFVLSIYPLYAVIYIASYIVCIQSPKTILYHLYSNL